MRTYFYSKKLPAARSFWPNSAWLTAAVCLLGLGVQAQNSTGLSLHELNRLVFPPNQRSGSSAGYCVYFPMDFVEKNALGLLAKKTPELTPGLLSACWSAGELPFFCRIEHQMNLKAPVQVKFRLGSVEYVDWLEGKRPNPF